MEQVVFELPSMYADHHVLAVRKALQNIAGTADIVASALERRVWVGFDPSQTSRDALVKGLGAAGYSAKVEPDLISIEPAIADQSAWFSFEPRVTKTNMADLEMSGDFRKY